MLNAIRVQFATKIRIIGTTRNDGPSVIINHGSQTGMWFNKAFCVDGYKYTVCVFMFEIPANLCFDYSICSSVV